MINKLSMLKRLETLESDHLDQKTYVFEAGTDFKSKKAFYEEIKKAKYKNSIIILDDIRLKSSRKERENVEYRETSSFKQN